MADRAAQADLDQIRREPLASQAHQNGLTVELFKSTTQTSDIDVQLNSTHEEYHSFLLQEGGLVDTDNGIFFDWTDCFKSLPFVESDFSRKQTFGDVPATSSSNLPINRTPPHSESVPL